MHNMLLSQLLINDAPYSIACYNIIDVPFHLHEDTQIIYVIKGSVIINCLSDCFTLKAGDFIILNPAEIHGIQLNEKSNAPPGDNLAISFVLRDAFWGIEDYLFVNIPSSMIKKHFANEVFEMRAHLHAIYKLQANGAKKDEIFQKIRSLLKIMINSFQMHFFVNTTYNLSEYKEHDLHIERIGSIIRYLSKNFGEKITLEDLSKLTNINKYYLSKLIKKGFDRSFMNLLNLVRAYRAINLLLGTNDSIREIYEQTGFSSYNSFTTSIKKLVGLTPLEFRKQYQKRTIAKSVSNIRMIQDPSTVFNIFQSMQIRKSLVQKAQQVYLKAVPYPSKNETVIIAVNQKQHDILLHISISKRISADPATAESIALTQYDMAEEALDVMSLLNLTNQKEIESRLEEFMASEKIPSVETIAQGETNAMLAAIKLGPGKSVMLVVQGDYSINMIDL